MKPRIRLLSYAISSCTAMLSLAAAPSSRVAAHPSSTDVSAWPGIIMTDLLNKDWPRAPIERHLRWPAGTVTDTHVTALDSGGTPVPVQVDVLQRHPDGSVAEALLAMFADLKSQGQSRYTITPGPAVPPINPARAITDAGNLIMDNGLTAIRLPPPGLETYDPPQSLATNQTLALASLSSPTAFRGPIQGFRLSNGQWTGGSYFYTPDPLNAPRLVSRRTRIVRQGPLFAEAIVEYALDNGGYYQCDVTLAANEPSIQIRERFDTKIINNRLNCSVNFALTTGGTAPKPWRLDTYLWLLNPYGGSLPDQKTPAGELLKSLFPGGTANRCYGSFRIPYADALAEDVQVEPWFYWGNIATAAALIDGQALAAATRGAAAAITNEAQLPRSCPFVAIIPQHAGSWRLDGPGFRKGLRSSSRGDVVWSLPLIAGSHPSSILHSGEWDPSLPYTEGRRYWTLLVDAPRGLDVLHRYRLNRGYITLNEYMEWDLDWQQDDSVVYPRLVFGPDEVERVRQRLATHPFKARLEKTIYFNDTQARADELLRQVENIFSSLARQYMETSFQRFRTSQEVLPLVGAVDELLSSKRLDPATRHRVRQRIAALAYIVSSPDFNPRGSMVHQGNPNMAMNRGMALPMLAALIPDHPMARKWMETSRDELRFQLAKNAAPGGGWSEILTYYEAGANHLVQGALVLHQAGLLDKPTLRTAVEVGMFPLDFMTPPHPRFAGARMMPMFGHEGWDVNNHWIVTAALAQRLDPALARAAMWAWSQQGSPTDFRHSGLENQVLMGADAYTGASAPTLASKWIPGVGTVMRANAGHPQETTLLYRSGYCVSHADPDQNSFVLWSRGAPLVTISLFGYALSQQPPYEELSRIQGWFSRPRWADQSAGDWTLEGNLQSLHFGPEADALRTGWMNGYREWIRQIMMVKGKTPAQPTYVLIRDNQRPLYQDTPMQWLLRTEGTATQIQFNAHGMTYTSTLGPRLDVRFLEPYTVSGNARTGSTVSQFSDPTKIALWRKGGSPIVAESRFSISVPESLTVNRFGPIPADQPVLCLMQPRVDNEPAVKASLISSNLVEVITDNTRDLILVSANPTRCTRGDMTLEGTLILVREESRERRIVIAEASPMRPASVQIGKWRLTTDQPLTRTLEPADLDHPANLDETARAGRYDLAVNPADGPVQSLSEGVSCQRAKSRVTYLFDTATAATLSTGDGITFCGRQGRIVVDTAAETVRFTVKAGDKFVYAPRGIAHSLTIEGSGPYDITVFKDRIAGRTEGQARLLQVTRPAGISVTSYLYWGDTPYAPGQAGETLVIPVPEGANDFRVTAMTQPPVFDPPEFTRFPSSPFTLSK